VPSRCPTRGPSQSPTLSPSASPSTTPSSTNPTPAPSLRPTRHPTIRSTRTPTVSPSATPITLNTQGASQEEQRKYRARESAMLGYAVAGLLGLGFVYQLFRWCRYKVHMVKEDKKRVKEMVAQDLPGKSRYPLFSATAGLCCNLDIVESQQEEGAGESGAAVVAVVPVNTIDVSHHSYTGQGAYMDGPASFVDLEANMRPCSSSRSYADEKKIKEGKEKKNDDVAEQHQAEVHAEQSATPVEGTVVALDVDSQQGDISDLSEASCASEGGVYHADDDSNSSDLVLSEESTHSHEGSEGEDGGEESYASGESWDVEPSGDGDVVYSISSDDDEGSNGSEGMDDSGAAESIDEEMHSSD